MYQQLIKSVLFIFNLHLIYNFVIVLINLLINNDLRYTVYNDKKTIKNAIKPVLNGEF